MDSRYPDGIRPKGEGWYGRWYDEHGVRRERFLSKDKREAVRLRNEITARVRRLRLGLDDTGQIEGQESLLDLVDKWEQHLEARTSGNHARDSRRGVLRVIELVRARTARDLDSSALNRVLIDLVGSGVANRTANKIVGYVKSFIKWAKRSGLVGRLPDIDVDPLPTSGRYSRRVRRRLMDSEMDALHQAAAGDSVEVLFSLIAGTGMRLGEALAASWADVDGSRIWISAADNKTHRGRAAAMPEWLVAKLAEERVQRGRAAKKKVRSSDPVAVSSRGKRWSEPGARNAFVRLLKRAGMSAICPDGTVRVRCMT